jgi:trans-aconitate methyltransferase
LTTTLPHNANRLIDTSERAAVDEWDELLGLQVDLFAAVEFNCLSRMEAWAHAQSVLEVGCGNGRYLAQLRSRFPKKDYVGIDLSPGLIAIANQRHRRSGLRFEQGDFLGTRPLPRCDLMILRFVVQHLDSFDAIIKRAAEGLEPKGSVIIIECDVARSAVSPPMPLFSGLLAAFEAHQSAEGRLRARLDQLATVIESLNAWRIASDAWISVSARGPFLGTKTEAVFEKWIDLCERAGGFAYPFDETREEVARWGHDGAASSMIALRMVELAYDRGA